MKKSTALLIGAFVVKKLVLVAILLYGVAEAATPALPPLQLPPPPPAATDLQTFGTGIPLAEFLRITLGEMGRRSYILAPEAAQSLVPISADLTKVRLKDPIPLVREVLDGMGLTIRDVSGVLLIERKRQADKPKADTDTIIYRPRNRTVGSLSSYFSLYPDLVFSYSAGISVRSLSPSSGSGVSAPAGQPGQPVQQTMDSGATTFSAQDKDPSFLVVKGEPAQLAKFQVFLAQVDVPVPEVLLKAYVFEVRDTTSKDSAVQLIASILGGRLGLSLGVASTAGDSLRLSLPNISVAINALTGDSRVRLVSSPTLRAADGTTASASIGTDTPTLGSIVSQNGSTQQSVTYQSAGVLLSVSPRILDDSIRLSISQELSSFVRTDTGLSDTPTKLRRAFRSDVIARNGEAILLGGLSEAQRSEARQGNFVWFGSKSNSTSSSEIVVLLQVERL